MKIFKYTIPLEGCIHNIPAGAKFLSCQLQRNQVVVWYFVNPDNYILPVKFTTVGTGNEVPEQLNHFNFLESVQFGPLVIHVFAEQTLGQPNDDSLQNS